MFMFIMYFAVSHVKFGKGLYYFLIPANVCINLGFLCIRSLIEINKITKYMRIICN